MNFLSFQVTETSSPVGKDRSQESQHNVWRQHIFKCSEAGNSELESDQA